MRKKSKKFDVKRNHHKVPGKIFSVVLLVCLLTFIFDTPLLASASNTVSTDSTPFEIGISVSGNEEDGGLASTLQILLLLTVIGLAPSILIMVTSFTRIIIVLHFVRAALATQTTPPNQVLIGLALFLTFFIMSPVFMQINEEAIQPLSEREISAEEALTIGMEPLRTFMFGQTGTKDLQLFLNLAEITEVDTLDDIPSTVLIPAFIISELRIAFIIGFLLYIPFLIIDMVVASTLMSMGMMMLPPTTISMPFKILLFIMVDGWNLVVGELIKTFM